MRGAVTCDLLDAIELFIRRFVVIEEAQSTAVALWVAHTWTVEAAYSTPYLFVTSAEPESGKTRLLELFKELARDPLSTMNISDAALFRVIEAKQPSLLFDEVDAIFNDKARERGVREDLRALLNAGYRRGERVYRMGGGNHTTLESFAVFCPKALAGLGNLPQTLRSRCIRLEVKRRRLNEPIEDFFPEDVAAESDQLRGRLETWTDLAVEALRGTRPLRVDGMRDRANEVWRPLLAIAELAGPVWAARARRAALALSADGVDDGPSLGLLLLNDIRTLFDDQQVERTATADVLKQLARVEESPWREWWLDDRTGEPTASGPRRLAKLLAPYGIKPKVVRIGTETPHGYRREQFIDAWERFLDPPRRTATSATAATPQPRSQADVADVADVAHERDGCEHIERWRSRDGEWHCTNCQPPMFAGEVIEYQTAHDADMSAGRSTS